MLNDRFSMSNNFRHRTTNYYVRNDYEGVMFRYDAQSDRYFRRFIDERVEVEVSRDNKLLFDTLLTGREITSHDYKLGI